MIETLAAAQETAAAGYSFAKLAVALVAVLVATKALGWAASRLGQSGSLGEIVAGIILGSSLLGLVDPHDPVIHALSQAGILVLLFSAGLHTEPDALVRPAAGARSVAAVGFVAPFILGFGATYLLGSTWIESLIAAAAMGATAVFVAARTLRDLGLLESEEGRLVQGVAVIDDVISLGVIAVVMALVTSSASTAELILRTLLVPGAFIAGLLVDAKGLSGRVDRVTSWLYWLIAPFFFAVTGAVIDLRVFTHANTVVLALTLIVLGVVGKLVSGWGARGFTGNRLLVGAAMMPRGAMGLIFAQLGWAAGAIDGAVFAAIVALVFVTSIITAPAVRALARTGSTAPAPA